ncbi:MAG: hypothetical protein WC156_10900 [Pedobacter sp.]
MNAPITGLGLAIGVNSRCPDKSDSSRVHNFAEKYPIPEIIDVFIRESVKLARNWQNTTAFLTKMGYESPRNQISGLSYVVF